MFCPSKSGFIMYNIIMAHVHYSNTHLIFREVQYTNLKFVTENANANQFRNRLYLLQTVLMETNVFWTSIVEKVVNVIRLVGKHMGNHLSYVNRVFLADEFLLTEY